MSVQFGRWGFDEEPGNAPCTERVRTILSACAPDGVTTENSGPLTLVFGAFHTSTESARQRQPFVSRQGNWFMWDGRLDNREECLRALDIPESQYPDVAIVARAYERWGAESFGSLMGDWALSIWNPVERCVLLATDFLGTRRLYYSIDHKRVVWSTILDPLVLFSDSLFTICEEYLAGWLSAFPRETLTPFKDICAVPPGHCVSVRKDSIVTRQFWKFDSRKRARCRNDREFEEEFLSLFQKSVARRLRSSSPVLAELSGGVDSSSIVCTADRLCTQGIVDQRLDTVSYFDDGEPNWDERPFVAAVEKQRGRPGVHIDIGSPGALIHGDSSRFAAMPSYGDTQSDISRNFARCIASGSYKVVLSGTGGDEVTGGVPTPIPELADYLVSLKLGRFISRLAEWSLAKRKPAIHLLFHTLKLFGPVSSEQLPWPWLCPEFVRHNREALAGYPRRVNLRDGPPSFQANMAALDSLRRQFACTPPATVPVYEKRYPFLDRDFLAFCYSVPREQFVRPLQRRSLLRRAMKGIVPEEILNRKRKAFVVRQLMATLSEACDFLTKDRSEFLCASHGIAEFRPFVDALRSASRGHEIPLIPLIRTVALEQWLRTINGQSAFGSASFLAPASHDRSIKRRRFEILGREQSNTKGGESHEIQQA